MGIWRAGWNQAPGSVGSEPFAFSTLVNPELWVDPNNGSDAAPGTLQQPIQSINEGLSRLSNGGIGKRRLHLLAGTYALGASPKLLIPPPAGSSFAQAVGFQQTEPILIDNASPALVDALGVLTVGAGSTQGTGAPPNPGGTLVDSVGGLVVNAHRGKWIRFLTGTMAGKRFLVGTNSATTYTIASTFIAAPTNGDTYQLETSSAQITWSGVLSIQGAGGTGLGLFGVDFLSTASIDVRGLSFLPGQCRFPSLVSLSMNPNTFMTNLGFGQFFVSAGLPINGQTQGCYFGHASGGAVFVLSGALWQSFASVWNNVSLQTAQTGSVATSDSYHTGNAFMATVNNSFGGTARCKFDTVTPCPTTILNPGQQGGAIVFALGSKGTILDTDISNTPGAPANGDAIVIADQSYAELFQATGTGNAGAGCRILNQSGARNGVHVGPNSVTGVASDVIVGGNAAVTWAAATAAVKLTDIAAATPQLCFLSSP